MTIKAHVLCAIGDGGAQEEWLVEGYEFDVRDEKQVSAFLAEAAEAIRGFSKIPRKIVVRCFLGAVEMVPLEQAG